MLRSSSPYKEATIAQAKKSLRTNMRQRLVELNRSTRETASQALIERLVGLDAWQQAQQVCLFAPTSSEPNADNLWVGNHLSGKLCVYPAAGTDGLRLYRVESLTELATVPPWNLREPDPDPANEVLLSDVDLILVPGLAFDPRGGRLGRGGGFFDRLLAARGKRGPRAIGLGFGCQRVDRLPLAAHDVLLDDVILA